MIFYSASDPEFERFVLANAPLRRLATGFAWTEGPVWFADANALLFSDIPNNRILRWIPGEGTPDGTLTTFRSPSNFANGHTRDRQGRLVSCEHGARRVTRTEWDGSITVIADAYRGKRLNSPNDVVVKSDGTIWFTDPHYGIVSDYEGHRATPELPLSVYRVDPGTGAMEAVITEMRAPNGIAFSPDETRLYVADTGRMYEGDPTHIRVYDVAADGTLSNGRLFHEIDTGKADGFRCDTDGNLWSSAGDGVHCIAPDGRLLGRILVPERVSNLCFGGRGNHILYITATTSLYAIALNRSGVAVVPRG